MLDYQFDPGDGGVVEHWHWGHPQDGGHHSNDLNTDQGTCNHKLGAAPT